MAMQIKMCFKQVLPIKELRDATLKLGLSFEFIDIGEHLCLWVQDVHALTVLISVENKKSVLQCVQDGILLDIKEKLIIIHGDLLI